MINPVSIIRDVNLAVEAVERMKKAVPLLQELAADVKTISEDKGDPTKLEADILELLSDINTDLQLISSLFPPSEVTKGVVAESSTPPPTNG